MKSEGIWRGYAKPGNACRRAACVPPDLAAIVQIDLSLFRRLHYTTMTNSKQNQAYRKPMLHIMRSIEERGLTYMGSVAETS